MAAIPRRRAGALPDGTLRLGVEVTAVSTDGVTTADGEIAAVAVIVATEATAALRLLPGLHEPKPYLTPDPVENRRSAKRLAELEPKVVLFGHGAPVRDARKFVDFVEKLP